MTTTTEDTKGKINDNEKRNRELKYLAIVRESVKADLTGQDDMRKRQDDERQGRELWEKVLSECRRIKTTDYVKVESPPHLATWYYVKKEDLCVSDGEEDGDGAEDGEEEEDGGKSEMDQS